MSKPLPDWLMNIGAFFVILIGVPTLIVLERVVKPLRRRVRS